MPPKRSKVVHRLSQPLSQPATTTQRSVTRDMVHKLNEPASHSNRATPLYKGQPTCYPGLTTKTR